MLLDQFGKPLTIRESVDSGRSFGMGAGQSTIDGPFDEVMPLNYISAPRNPWEAWEFRELDEDNLSRYTIDQIYDIIISISPEASLSLWHANRFVNPYFWFEFDNPEDARTIEAVDRWMEMFTNYYGGFDTIVSQAVAGLFTRGSIFAEMVFENAGDGLLEPVDLLVRDPIWVRFYKQDDPKRGRVWHYGQWIKNRFRSFQNDPSVLYMPLDPFPGPMYGRSMMGSAIYCTIFIVGMLREIRRVIANQGYPRLDISVDLQSLESIYNQLKSSNPDTASFPEWAQSQMDNITALYNKLQAHQAFVHDTSVNVNPHPGALNQQLSMLDEIVRMLERQLVRAYKSVPLMHGSNESLAESQADAQFVIYTESINALKRAIAIVISMLFSYGLRMSGIMNRARLHFGMVNEMQAKLRAETRQIEIQNIVVQMDAGLIDREEGQAQIDALKSEREGHYGKPPRLEQARYFAYALPSPKKVRFIPNRRTGYQTVESCIVEGPEEAHEHECDHAAHTGGDFHEEELAVQISPEGSEEGLPELPTSVPVTDVDAGSVTRLWNTQYPNQRDLLTAKVVNMALPGDGFADVSAGNWEWNDQTKRFRNLVTGANITDIRRIELRDEYIQKQLPAIRRLVNQLRDGEITVQEYLLAVRRHIKKVYLGEWLLAKGGVNAMTTSDVRLVGIHVQRQYQFLQNFIEQVRNGELSAAQIRSRTEMYVHSATQAYERGQASSYDIDLPEYPGDGNQICLSRCKCRWEIVRTDTQIQAHWLMNITAEHCESCRQNTAKWNPFIIEIDE